MSLLLLLLLQEWAAELFKYATNLLQLNSSPLQYLEKCWTKLTIATNANGLIPMKKYDKEAPIIVPPLE